MNEKDKHLKSNFTNSNAEESSKKKVTTQNIRTKNTEKPKTRKHAATKNDLKKKQPRFKEKKSDEKSTDIDKEKIEMENNTIKSVEKEIAKQEEIKIEVEQLETIKNEINKNKQEAQSKNDIKYQNMFKNLIIGICLIVYFLLLLLGNNKIPTIEFLTDIKTFVVFETIATIVLFEIAYKKDDDKLALHGIEILAIDATTLLLFHLNSRGSIKFNLVIIAICLIIPIYYIIKSLIIRFKK